MSNRQKIYVGLAVSAGVCTGVALFLYFRHRRQLASSKDLNTSNNSVTPSSLRSSLRYRRGNQYHDITSTSQNDHDQNESIRFQSHEGATVEVNIPGGATALTTEQAIILTRFLQDNKNNIELLNRILTNIANGATFKESQINLANAGCIDCLRDLLSTIENETTLNKILLALNNLALNEETIIHYSGIISIVINLCRKTPVDSSVRLHGLNLLVNMSVLEYLHEEFMDNIYELGSLIETTFPNNEQMLSAGKILVNLSTNKSNLDNLLKLTGIELKTIIPICTPRKQLINNDHTTKLEEILLRYLNFYCNLADIIVNDLQNVEKSKAWLNDPIPYRSGAVYFELFDHDTKMSTKSILRSQYISNDVNRQVKRFRQLLDTIRQRQFDSNISSIHDEFNDHEQLSSTPKKTSFVVDETNPMNNLEDLVNKQFDDEDETILPEASTPSDQSLASFRSAYSTTENNTYKSPENSITT